MFDLLVICVLFGSALSLLISLDIYVINVFNNIRFVYFDLILNDE